MGLFDEHPLVIPVAALGAGVVCAATWPMNIPFWWVVIVLPVLLVLAAAIRTAWPFGVVFGVFCFCWGIVSMHLTPLHHGSPLGNPPYAGNLVVEGVVASRPSDLPQGQRFELDLERIIAAGGEALGTGRLLVTVANGRGNWLTGDRVRLRGILQKPHHLGLPGEFNYARYLALRGITATLWVPDAGQVVVMRSGARFTGQHLLDEAALRCNEAIKRAVKGPDAAAVLMALVTGSQTSIPPALSTAYARAGVSHILSISGFHVAVIAATAAQLLLIVLTRWEWLALRWNLRRVVLLATLPVMLGYLLFTGGAPATARSVIMLAAVSLALWAERESEVLDALLLAALLLILYSPAVVFDLSFQLSFLSLWGIVVFTPLLLAPCKGHLSGWGRQLALFFAASLSAILATSIPTLVAFHQASVTGLLANIVVVPLLGYGAVLLGAVAAPLVYAFPALADRLFGVAGWLVEISNLFVRWVADLPVLRSYQVGMVDFGALLAVLSVVSFIATARLRKILIGSIVAGVVLLHLVPTPDRKGHLRIAFLSVGQADAAILQFPDQSTMLIDGGGYLRDTGRDFGERYLVPALHQLGITKIDRVVLTHPHPDHFGGLPAVLEEFPVGEFWQGPCQGDGSGEYGRMQAILRRRGVPIRQLQPGCVTAQIGGCLLTAVTPPAEAMPGTGCGGEAGNEASVVFRLDFKQFSALLMGDAGLQTERRLLQQGQSPVTLLKVGHHGSRTASGELFIHQVRPRLAVISVGAKNRFGLPSAETVRRLESSGSRIYRTDQDGTVQVDTDGVSHQVTTTLGGSV